MCYFGLAEDGKYDANRSDRGLLCVNHEYVVQPFGIHPAGQTAGAVRVAKDVASLKRYGLPENRKSPYLWDTAGSDDLFARWSSSVMGATATEDYRNTANNFGWVVEIDPFNNAQVPAKRTALGRFNHEGAWPAPAVVGQPIVIYQGDDARNEYIYKFVSKALWSASDVNGGLAAGAKYLDEGTLYVAKFNADGTGVCIDLAAAQDEPPAAQVRNHSLNF